MRKISMRGFFKKCTGTLKAKLILGFVLVVTLTSAASIVSYITLRSLMTKLDNMVQTTIVANEKINSSSKIPQLLSDLIIEEKKEQKDAINVALESTRKDIACRIDKQSKYCSAGLC